MFFYDIEIASIDRDGMLLKNKTSTMYLSFSDSARHFSKHYSSKTNLCVGARDITRFMFAFYNSNGEEVRIIIRKKHLFDFSRSKRFFELQNKIALSGYSTFDLS